jgi:hypothetical protein
MEQSAKKVIGTLLVLHTIVNDRLDRTGRQQIDIFTEHCDERLKDKALRLSARNRLAWSLSQSTK